MGKKNRGMYADSNRQQGYMQQQGEGGFAGNPYIRQGGGAMQQGMMMNPYIQDGAYPQQGMRRAYAQQGMNRPYLQQGMQQPYLYAMQNSRTGMDTRQLLTGALIGAGVTYLLTNDNVQKKVFKTFAGISDLFVGAVEEVKERYEDAKAEIEAEKFEDRSSD